jgi:hypothetical protein
LGKRGQKDNVLIWGGLQETQSYFVTALERVR